MMLISNFKSATLTQKIFYLTIAIVLIGLLFGLGRQLLGRLGFLKLLKFLSPPPQPKPYSLVIDAPPEPGVDSAVSSEPVDLSVPVAIAPLHFDVRTEYRVDRSALTLDGWTTDWVDATAIASYSVEFQQVGVSSNRRVIQADIVIGAPTVETVPHQKPGTRPMTEVEAIAQQRGVLVTEDQVCAEIDGKTWRNYRKRRKTHIF